MGHIELERESVGEATVFVLRMVDEDNRFHGDSVAEWHAAVDAVEGFDGPAALVTTGNGRFYSNGFALERLIEEGTLGEVIPDALRLFARLLRLQHYTVAAVNGHAYAAGAMIAMAHDARVMRADRGYWCLPEADMGVPLAPGMSQLIAAKLTPAVTHAAVVTARRWGGEEAVTAAIVDEAVPEDQVLPRAIELAAARAGDQATDALRTGLYGPLLETLDRADIS
jgi:enoyl-CoA hydratase/carnithine racemase